jgi:hypothetical protein
MDNIEIRISVEVVQAAGYPGKTLAKRSVFQAGSYTFAEIRDVIRNDSEEIVSQALADLRRADLASNAEAAE